MATQGPPAGWHADPYQPGTALRWWDGANWSEHTQPLPSVPPPGAAAGYAPHAPAAQTWGYTPPPTAQPTPSWGYVPPAIGPQHQGGTTSMAGSPTEHRGSKRTFVQRNSLSLTTLGVVAAYMLLATATHFVLIGILPMGLSIRALTRREQLAPVALVAAIVSVVFALSVLTHH